MAAGIGGVESLDHGCNAFDESIAAMERSNAWFAYVQAFKRENNIIDRPLTDMELSQLDGEF
ncbi:MAG: hypothetical protein AAB457_01320 [Patescibacteria group bacterium]